jgi:hypothetical protein
VSIVGTGKLSVFLNKESETNISSDNIGMAWSVKSANVYFRVTLVLTLSLL